MPLINTQLWQDSEDYCNCQLYFSSDQNSFHNVCLRSSKTGRHGEPFRERQPLVTACLLREAHVSPRPQAHSAASSDGL